MLPFLRQFGQFVVLVLRAGCDWLYDVDAAAAAVAEHGDPSNVGDILGWFVDGSTDPFHGGEDGVDVVDGDVAVSSWRWDVLVAGPVGFIIPAPSARRTDAAGSKLCLSSGHDPTSQAEASFPRIVLISLRVKGYLARVSRASRGVSTGAIDR